MRFIANVFWFLLTGLWTAIMFFFQGLFWCITIVGIPFGLQAFKYAKLVLAPFGKKVQTNFGKHPIMNILWFIFGGFVTTLMFVFLGIVQFVTIIGIPCGLQAFKLAKLSIAPFGATIEKIEKK